MAVMNILNMLYNLHFFSSKCRLFHNATLFGFCITHILNTGCAKICKKKKVRRQKVKLIYIKVKVKVTQEQATKAQRGVDVYLYSFFNLGARWGWAVNALPSGKTRYPLHWRLGVPQGRFGRARKISPPTGIRSPDRPARSERLYQLSYPGTIVSRCHYKSGVLTESLYMAVISTPISRASH